MAGDYLNPDDGDPQDDVATETEGRKTEDEFEVAKQDLAPEGDYDAVCSEAYSSLSKKGNKMITVTLACPEVPSASADYYLVNSPKAAWRFTDGLAAFGVPLPAEGEKFKFKREDFVGKKVRATGYHDTYQGHKNFKWETIAAPPEGAGARAFTPSDEDIPF